ncbi:NAD(P)/FAD-dependent oxidoreductase [Candidatus Woesearchaeota archaeon]|jgi:digeranylgeranylglycerophospholipid reductase|nr:NAD(P)/FAD-dependent oxidoreductase [Candidatus Woesearchaeota archaeon]MBT3538458.1 NAD(P)/FAD-dependent oxidoreductase [Candidatus Woesearchaeota archaeon]MBT4697021.1 NAD(P)/FAD-dependent oxidoreductase [Candidatus Woesearchaeota archaeon]MBT7106086.1 NAD(P)/FAD-dependent oxidoreductase [Candidatus Woesearchaeota archaeon]MBT7931016.1 NAD(P)/FAD-dependent oxidoreductase [Candidatus Woesearchaeota archaeon]
MISIIGGGPTGSYCAELLAKAGKTIEVYDARAKIGEPVQCTGIVTKSINDVIKIKKDLVINKVKRVKVVAPNGSELIIKNDDLVIDRCGFDNWLKERAEDCGAKYILRSKFERLSNNKAIINGKSVGFDKLIGADGPASAVAKSIGVDNRRYCVGAQARVKMNVDVDEYSVYLGNEVAPGFFGWIVPEDDNYAKVGVASEKNTGLLFDSFLKRLNVKKSQITSKQGGLIPIFNPKQKIEQDNVYLVGDSAGQVKATTGGGLVPGLKCVEGLADSIVNNKSYSSNIKATIRKLKLDLRIRKALNKFSDEDYNGLVDYFCKGRENILGKYSRDEPLLLATYVLFHKPLLLRFTKKFV